MIEQQNLEFQQKYQEREEWVVEDGQVCEDEEGCRFDEEAYNEYNEFSQIQGVP